ncbi:MAG: hypothetical protein GXX03_12555, partial [Bacteroidales bacterium]|nr:hypothetical protein [Bacteroidales bacterium]
NSQIIPKDGFLSVEGVSGTYVAPDIEVIDIEAEQSFLQTGSNGGDMPGDLL